MFCNTVADRLCRQTPNMVGPLVCFPKCVNLLRDARWWTIFSALAYSHAKKNLSIGARWGTISQGAVLDARSRTTRAGQPYIGFSDYGLEVSNPYDISAVSSVSKLTDRLRKMRPSIILYNLLGVDKKNMKQVLHDISKELHEYVRDTGFILVVLDSMSFPVLTKKSKHKIKELKNVEEHIFHPGGDSNHYCSMMTNMPRSYATYPLSQTSPQNVEKIARFPGGEKKRRILSRLWLSWFFRSRLLDIDRLSFGLLVCLT